MYKAHEYICNGNSQHYHFLLDRTTFLSQALHKKGAKEGYFVGLWYRDIFAKKSLKKIYGQEVYQFDVADNNPAIGKKDVFYLDMPNQRFKIAEPTEKQMEIYNHMVSGIVVALKAKPNEKFELLVEEVVFPGILSLPREVLPVEDVFTVLAHGTRGENIALAKKIASLKNVARLVLAGGTMPLIPLQTRPFSVRGSLCNTNKTKSVLPKLEELNEKMGEFAQVFPVDIMPGEEDLTNNNFPQKPIPKCFVSKLNAVGNPYHFDIGGTKIIGESGRIVKDIAALSTNDPLEALKLCLRCAHVAPTTPERTPACSMSKDPFIMTECPHVFFCGSKSFETEMFMFEGVHVRLICIPEFISTQQVVLLNLKDLTCVAL